MSIRQALLSDLSLVKEITEHTISEIYPHYYPKGAVDFFLSHHSEVNICNDIQLQRVYLYSDIEQNVVGTVTIRDNEICRLFVLPLYQGKGYGTEMLNFAEKVISDKYSKIVLAASLCAKNMYLRRGYKDIEYIAISTDCGDFLCYDIMEKDANSIALNT